MQWVYYQVYVIITKCYFIISKKTIITHFYVFQIPKLADALDPDDAGWRSRQC